MSAVQVHTERPQRVVFIILINSGQEPPAYNTGRHLCLGRFSYGCAFTWRRGLAVTRADPGSDLNTVIKAASAVRAADKLISGQLEGAAAEYRTEADQRTACTTYISASCSVKESGKLTSDQPERAPGSSSEAR